jgi:transcriptional regulator with XRE-family HTH domain
MAEEINPDDIEHLAHAMQRALEAMRQGADIPADALKVLAGAGRKAAQSQEDLAKQAQATKQAFLNVGSSMLSFAGQLGRGNTSLSTMSGMVNATGKYLQNLSAGLGPAGKAVGKFTALIADGTAYAMERNEAAFDSFRRLSELGAVGAEGIEGLSKSFTTAGMTLKQYEQMVVQSGRALAGLTGSTTDGAEMIAQAMNTMRGGLDQELRRLGFSTEEVSDTMIGYANLQRILGNQEQMTQAKLTLGTQQYGKELDELARLTGMSRKEQMKAMEEANRNSRFLAKIRELERAGKTAEVKELYKLNSIYKSISPELAAAFQDQVSGYLTTDAAIKGNISSNYAMLRSTQDVIAGNKNAVGAFQDVQQGIGEVLPNIETFGAAMGDQGPFMNLNTLVEAQTRGMGEIEKAAANAKESQKQQTAGSSQSIELMIDASRKLSDAASTLDAVTVSFSTVRDIMEGIAIAAKEATELLARAKGAPIAGEGYGGSPETEISITPTPEMAEMKALDVERNRLLDEIRATLPDEFASDEEIEAWQGLQQRVDGVNQRLDELKDITAAQTKAAQDQYLTPVSKIIDQAIKASGKPMGSASLQEALEGTELGEFGSIYHNGVVGPAKADEIRNLISEAGGIFSGEDGSVNVGLMDSIKNIIKRSDSATTVTAPTPKQTQAPQPAVPDTQQSLAYGGVATGPRSGYRATLHGTEAVIPLENQKIPVEIKDSRDMKPQMDLMERQIAKLDAVIDAIQKHTAVSEKMFRSNYS